MTWEQMCFQSLAECGQRLSRPHSKDKSSFNPNISKHIFSKTNKKATLGLDRVPREIPI